MSNSVKTRIRKLTQGEIKGIRLLADVFVIRDLQRNVLAKSEPFKPYLEGLESNLKERIPDVFTAEKEFKKQLDEVRQYWLDELTKSES